MELEGVARLVAEVRLRGIMYETRTAHSEGSVDVIKSAKGAYLEIISSSEH